MADSAVRCELVSLLIPCQHTTRRKQTEGMVARARAQLGSENCGISMS